jgi:glucokinase
VTIRASSPVAAVDIGGTKIAAALVGPEGELLTMATMPTPGGPPHDALASLQAWLRDFLHGRPVACVGVAIPAVTRDGRVQWISPTLPGWDGLPIAEGIADAAGAQVWCEFDGYAAIQGEAWCGAAKGSRNAAVVIVGTGIGAGFLCDGRVIRGAVGVAGTVGWLRFPDGRSPLGQPVESYASGPGLLRQAQAYQRAGSTPFRSAEDVLAAASAGDAAADRAVAEATAALASIVLTAMSTFAPEVVVLSGGVGSRPDIVTRVRHLVADAGHPFSGVKTTITASTLAGLSSLYGAGYFAYQTINAH